MSMHFIIALISGFLGFIIPIAAYKNFSSAITPFNSSNKNHLLFMLSLILTPFIICSVNYFLCFDGRDFISSFNFMELSIPFICATLLFLTSEYKQTSKFFILFLFLSSLAASFSIPDDSIARIIPLPVFYNKLILITSWFTFSYFYRYINSGSVLGIQSVAISLGIAILAMIGAIPFFLGLAGLVITTASIALSITTWPPAKRYISENNATCIGFIIFALMAWTATEGATSCALIFAMLFIMDILWAIFLRITFLEQYANIKDNTSYKYIISCGFSPRLASSFLVRGQILIIILGCFQAYSEQQYSLLLFSTFVAIWFLNKLRNLNLETTPINVDKEVINDIQDRINDLKQYVKEKEDD